MYSFEVSDKLHEKMTILFKKDKQSFYRLDKKIKEILNSFDIEHYKNLKYNLNEYKRVHIIVIISLLFLLSWLKRNYFLFLRIKKEVFDELTKKLKPLSI